MLHQISGLGYKFRQRLTGLSTAPPHEVYRDNCVRARGARVYERASEYRASTVYCVFVSSWLFN